MTVTKIKVVDNINTFLCVKCRGTGKIRSREGVGRHRSLFKRPCDSCNGEGRVDWIENIVGKKEDPDIHKWSFTDDPGPH